MVADEPKRVNSGMCAINETLQQVETVCPESTLRQIITRSEWKHGGIDCAVEVSLRKKPCFSGQVDWGVGRDGTTGG